MLQGLDALVIDLQDVMRSYTYVSCMRYAMEACFEAVEVVVLIAPIRSAVSSTAHHSTSGAATSARSTCPMCMG